MTNKNCVKNVNNIYFSFDNDRGIDFSFTYKCEGFKNAYLQLPSTPDSQHTIDDVEFDCDNEYHREVINALRYYFYADFHSVECAKASAFLGKRVMQVHAIDDLYVAFCEDSSIEVLKEGGASGYYNEFYFDRANFVEDDVVAKAIKELFSSLKNELIKKLSDSNTADADLHNFMKDIFCDEYSGNDVAQTFYENIACDCRRDREEELKGKDDK